MQELLSALVSPNQVPSDPMNDHRFDNLTVLRTGIHTDYLTQMDIMLLKIAEYYNPKEKIENILGL
ncbi:hypothetical protein ACFLS9_05085 [Bacteroidota bacterium]